MLLKRRCAYRATLKHPCSKQKHSFHGSGTGRGDRTHVRGLDDVAGPRLKRVFAGAPRDVLEGVPDLKETVPDVVVDGGNGPGTLGPLCMIADELEPLRMRRGQAKLGG